MSLVSECLPLNLGNIRTQGLQQSDLLDCRVEPTMSHVGSGAFVWLCQFQERKLQRDSPLPYPSRDRRGTINSSVHLSIGACVQVSISRQSSDVLYLCEWDMLSALLLWVERHPHSSANTLSLGMLERLGQQKELVHWTRGGLELQEWWVAREPLASPAQSAAHL